jgi:RNA polymerase sigma factor (sigma-70 family)
VGEELDGVVDAANAGAGWALEVLYRQLAPAVAGYLRVQGAAEPDDLTNEVFLRVFRDLASFSGTGSRFRSWVFSIAHARLIDERRRLGRRIAVSDDALSGIDVEDRCDVESDVLQALAQERVRTLCGRLAPDQRDVLLLRLVADLTIEQAAGVVGKSVGATKALQRRGLVALRKELEREGVPL